MGLWEALILGVCLVALERNWKNKTNLEKFVIIIMNMIMIYNLWPWLTLGW